MIGSIRKHSSWLWWIIAGLTILSFVYWGVSPSTRYGGQAGGGLGTLYGKKITADDYELAKREFFISFWQKYHQFPDRSGNISQTDIERAIYERLLLAAKAEQLGIHVSPDAEVAEANNFLRSLVREGDPVPQMSTFVEKILQPAGLGAADFQHFIDGNLVIDQMVQTMGLSGTLVPPQEAGELYDRENREYSAQAVFFSASNYVAQIPATPAAVAQFFTNYMAHYRVPERVAVHYIAYDLTNFMAAAVQKLGKTNIAAQADAYYAQKGAQAVPEAKTPEEAKAKIRELITRQEAGGEAATKAKDFLRELFAMEPVAADNLVALAKTNGIAVGTTMPFTEEEGPMELSAPADLVKEAFALTPDSPFSTKPIVGADAVYLISLANRLPSEVPAFDFISDRVKRDYQSHEAAIMARSAGTNFYFSAVMQMATGKTFAQAAEAAGQVPFSLKPFSLNTQDIPEAEGHTDANQVKNAAFTTQPGHISELIPSAEGGFVLYVKSLLPVDEMAKTAALPKYLNQLRRQHESEAFTVWLQLEESHQFHDTPLEAELKRRQAPGGQ
jgi:hypothetical protein